MENKNLIEMMNVALGLELRAINMYAHYSSYVKGIHRLHLSQHFKDEVTESLAHAETIRSAIVKMGGQAVTERDNTPILHTTSYPEMLQEALNTEVVASETYRVLLEVVEEMGDRELYDSIEAIYLTELRSVEEVRLLME